MEMKQKAMPAEMINAIRYKNVVFVGVGRIVFVIEMLFLVDFIVMGSGSVKGLGDDFCEI